jgi:Flp pilus assembly protein TadG
LPLENTEVIVTVRHRKFVRADRVRGRICRFFCHCAETVRGAWRCDGGQPGDAPARVGLLGEASAVSAIEFAILLPLFVGLMFMIAQIGLYFYLSTSLYYATAKAARQIMTGAVLSQSLNAAEFRNNVLCPLLPGSMSCNNIITNVQVVPPGANGASWAALTNNMTGLISPAMNNAQTSFCIGAGGSLVAMQVYYAMPVLGISQMLPNASSFNGQSVIFISATAAWKNEPFSTANAGC